VECQTPDIALHNALHLSAIGWPRQQTPSSVKSPCDMVLALILILILSWNFELTWAPSQSQSQSQTRHTSGGCDSGSGSGRHTQRLTDAPMATPCQSESEWHIILLLTNTAIVLSTIK